MDALKLLLIEQDPGFARFVGEMLVQARELTVEVAVAPDLASGVSALTAGSHDLVLMNLALPDGAGLANVALLKARAPQVPVIVLGDSDDENVFLESVHAGAQDYLVKGQLTPSWLERSIHYAVERYRMDRALREAEERYHSLFDHLVEGIFQTSPDGRYLMANAALARIYGYPNPEELMCEVRDIGRSLYIEPGRREEFVRLMQENDTLTGFESPVHRRDGAVIWISENCRAIRDPAGNLLYYEGTVEDITQRRQAEIQLRHSEELYHSLVETLPQNIFRKDRLGRFTFANQQFCQTLGLSLEQIVGRTDHDFFPEDLAAKYQNDDQRVMAQGCHYETVEEHRPPGKPPIYVQVVKTPLWGADGQVIGLQAIFWDITAQRLAEENIRQANAELARSRQELRLRNQQMEEDLHMAREIQLTMLPQQYPVFPESVPAEHSAFQFTHRYLPTGSVGGDFFTVSRLSDTQCSVFLCDVAGHGVRSALVTAMVRALVEELKPLATHPGQFLTKLNTDLWSILHQGDTPVLTTAFYLVADAATGLMQYANAGHPKPLHVRRRAAAVVPLSNAFGRNQPALGLMQATSYQASEILLLPHDLLLLFTDGLIEVENPAGQLYSVPQVAEEVERHLDLPASSLCDVLLQEARQFAAGGVFTDDVCLVGIEFQGQPRPFHGSKCPGS